MNYIYFNFILFIMGCSVQYSKLTGEYVYKNTEINVRLIMNNDSTFSIRRNDLGVINTCQGKMLYIKEKRIRLICIYDEGKPVELLKSNFFKYNEAVTIINSNTIKIGNMILKKKLSHARASFQLPSTETSSAVLDPISK